MCNAANDREDELLLASLMKIHSDKCTSELCPCGRRDNLYDPKTRSSAQPEQQLHQDVIFLKHYIVKIIRNGTLKCPESKKIHLDFIYFLFETLGCYTLVFDRIERFRDKFEQTMSMTWEFLLYRLAYKSHEYVHSTNTSKKMNNIYNLENVVLYDKKFAELHSKIYDTATSIYRVWESLKEVIPDLPSVKHFCKETVKNKKQTLQLYEEVKRLNKQSIQLKILMLFYSELIA
jgi:hypothetical protein